MPSSRTRFLSVVVNERLVSAQPDHLFDPLDSISGPPTVQNADPGDNLADNPPCLIRSGSQAACLIFENMI